MQKSLNKQAEIDINKLVSETGHVITAADLPALFRLNDLAQKVTDSNGPITRTIMEMPVRCGNVWLQHPTIARLCWIESHEEWMSKQYMLWLGGCAFACCTETDDATLDRLTEEDEVRRAIIKFGRKLDVNIFMLSCIIKSLLLASEDASGEANENYWNIISFMAREYGATPHYWRHEAGIGEIIALLDEYNSRMEEQMKEAEKAAKKKIVAPDTFKTMRRYRKYFNSLKKRWEDREMQDGE